MKNLSIFEEKEKEINILSFLENNRKQKEINNIIKNETNYNILSNYKKNFLQSIKNLKVDVWILDERFFPENKKLFREVIKNNDSPLKSFIIIVDDSKLKDKNSDPFEFINKNQDCYVDIIKKPLNIPELKIKLNNISKLYKKYNNKIDKVLFFKKTIDNIDKSVYIIDKNGKIKYVNNTFEDITGYKKNEVIGKSASILNIKEKNEKHYRDLWKNINRGEIKEEKIINKKKSGELFRAKQTIFPILDNNKRKGLLIIQTDITRNKLITEQLNVLHQMLRHHLRNDVSKIQVYTDIINDNNNNYEIKKATQKILEASKKMEDLGEKANKANKALTSLSRPIDLPVKINNILEYTKKDIKKKYPKSTISIKKPKKEIKVDYILQTALEEIVENAVKHNNNKKPKVEIDIEEKTKQKMVDITIKDNGPGIPREEKKFLKNENKLPTINNRGIGLWLVYWIVKSLGGKINIQNKKLKGTSINLKIPILKNNQKLI